MQPIPPSIELNKLLGKLYLRNTRVGSTGFCLLRIRLSLSKKHLSITRNPSSWAKVGT